MRIILADDEPLSRELVLRMIRSRTDYDVTAVDDGEKALALALADPTPDVLLLDWMMPGLSGTDVCARVRASGLALQPYIVLLTAKSKREEALEGMRVGADDFLSKPVAPDVLIARLSPAGRRPAPGQSQSRAVAQALFRARDAGDGELIIKDGELSARVLFHGRRVAWAHVSDDRNALLEILAPEVGIDAQTAHEVVAECRRTGARLSDTLISFGLIDRAQLREHLLTWTKRKIRTILGFSRPELLFLPQRRQYSEDLLFDLEELLSDEQRPARPDSIRPPAPAPLAATPTDRLWQDAFSTPGAEGTQAAMSRVLENACRGEGVLGAAIIDRLTGVCLLHQGCDLSPDVAWAHLQTINVLSRQERVEDSIVVTDTRYHLVRFIPSAPDCFVYLVADAKQVLIAAARLDLQRAVGA
ncbi:MAG TPA: response regulator transcription factor [Polyangiaceae bacterium]|nr:response regulator transcription factor [Polyangiaceae bacterium]